MIYDSMRVTAVIKHNFESYTTSTHHYPFKLIDVEYNCIVDKKMIVLYGYIGVCHLYWKSNIYDYPEILIAMAALYNMAFVKQLVTDKKIFKLLCTEIIKF